MAEYSRTELQMLLLEEILSAMEQTHVDAVNI